MLHIYDLDSNSHRITNVAVIKVKVKVKVVVKGAEKHCKAFKKTN